MELKDTVEMMGSSDYKERFRAEYFQFILYLMISSLVYQLSSLRYCFKIHSPLNIFLL